MTEREIFSHESAQELSAEKEMVTMYKNCPVYDDELLMNLGLFLNSKELARILFMNNVYRQIIDVPGVIMEFGVHWGGFVSLVSTKRMLRAL